MFLLLEKSYKIFVLCLGKEAKKQAIEEML